MIRVSLEFRPGKSSGPAVQEFPKIFLKTLYILFYFYFSLSTSHLFTPRMGLCFPYRVYSSLLPSRYLPGEVRYIVIMSDWH